LSITKQELRIEYAWAMPNKNTFDILPIKNLINEEMSYIGETIDPFAKDCKVAKYTNDINPKAKADYHMDALKFLNTFQDNSLGGGYYDPVYTPRQLKECYDSIGQSLTWLDTSAKTWRLWKEAIARVIKPGGKVLSCGYTGYGLGNKLGFQLIRVLVVVHGGVHNATICTVEVKA